MGIALSSAGITLKYAVETTAGTRPTTGYTNIPDIKSIPDFNVAPDSLETTDLSATEYKTYINGLKSLDGSLGFDANFTTALKTAWESLITAFTTGKASNKATWFAITVPNFATFYFTGEPSALGLPSVGVNEVLSGQVHIAPSKVHGWDTVLS